jgi:hypothetical protein
VSFSYVSWSIQKARSSPNWMRSNLFHTKCFMLTEN